MAGFTREMGSYHTDDDDGIPLTDFIQATDETRAFAKPSNIDKFHTEFEHEHGADEQRHAYRQKGEVEAAPADETAGRLEHTATMATKLSEQMVELALAAWAIHKTAWEALHGYVRRPTDSKWLKWLRWGLMLGGDVAGISGAALLLGEQFLNAFLQALSVGAAAVTLGAVGREWRYVLAARAREKQPADLTDNEKLYPQFFAGPHEGEVLVKFITMGAASGIALIAGGIFALRDSTEGLMAGIAFAFVALAIGLGSLVNAFDVADDIAEMLDNLLVHATKLTDRAEKAHHSPVIQEWAAAVAAGKSVRAAHSAGGDAAAQAVLRHLHWVLGQSPGVAGNGTASGQPAADERRNGHEPEREVPEPHKKAAE